MLKDFTNYYELARAQGNTEAMAMIKNVILMLLE